LFGWLTVSQPAVLFSHIESAPVTSQSAVLFSHIESAPATSQPTIFFFSQQISIRHRLADQAGNLGFYSIVQVQDSTARGEEKS
jgi:hypothetical protein